MRRGDLVTVALQGEHGKPRPALVIQTDIVPDHPSIVVLPLTSTLTSAPMLRIAVEPVPETGLRRLSQVMVDRPIAVRRERLGEVIGRVDDATLARITRVLAMWLGIG